MTTPLSTLLADGEFLVCYDYGMGGLWAVLIAPSKAAIHVKYPELFIVNALPDWLTVEDLARMKEVECVSLDDEPPRGLLKALIADRRQD